jgi:DNA gyrase subunit A
MLTRDSELREEMFRVAGAPPDSGVRLTRVQAEAIGNMRLIQLVNLEVSKLVEELLELQTRIRDFSDILARRERINAMIKADCDEMRSRYGSGPAARRLTRIEDTGGDINIEALIQEEDVAVTISHQGYAKRVSVATYRQQGRGGKGIIAGAAKDDDFIEHMFVASTHDDLLCFTDLGRVFKMKVYELPDLPRTSKGRAMVNLIELKRHGGETGKQESSKARNEAVAPGAESAPAAEGAGTGSAPEPAAESRPAQRTEQVRAFLAVKNFEEGSSFLTFVSRDGIVKRTPLKDYRHVNKSGIIAVGLKEGDEVLDVTLTGGNDDLLLATARGMAIRFNEQDVRLMGRAAAGVKGIELSEGDEVVGVVPIPMAPDAEGDMMTAPSALPAAGAEPGAGGAGLCLLTITENGYGKRTAIDEYRVQPETGKLRSQSRGGKGRVDIDTGERNGRAIAALGVKDGDDVVVISKNGQLVRMAASTIRVTGRGAMGVKVVGLYEADKVVAAARVAGEE